MQSIAFTLHIQYAKIRFTAKEVIKQTLNQELFEVPSIYNQKMIEDFKKELKRYFEQEIDKGAQGL